jgi:hypothetical chaperone protein
MANACGVDFGTSNSTVGLIRPNCPTLLALEDGMLTLPSVIFFNAEDQQISVGRAALATYLSGVDGRLMRSLKSLLGTPLIDSQTEVAGRAVPFRQLLSLYISELKRRAEGISGQSLSQVVVGRPVFFVDADSAADRHAEQTLEAIVREAGFEDIVFQYEPIAAALNYESGIDREELVLVADIGGGTSDFSVVRLGPRRQQRRDRQSDILANGGVHIGGTDFDKYLSLATVMPLLGMGSRLRNGTEVPSANYFNLATWHTINLLYTRKVWHQLGDIQHDLLKRDQLNCLLDLIQQRSGHWLAMQVEQRKIALSDAENVSLSLDRLNPRQELTITRGHLRTAIAHLHDTITQTVSAMLSDATIDPDCIDTVFFTGGASNVGGLRERIAALVPNARYVEGDLFGSIGAGLALEAQRHFG